MPGLAVFATHGRPPPHRHGQPISMAALQGALVPKAEPPGGQPVSMGTHRGRHSDLGAPGGLVDSAARLRARRLRAFDVARRWPTMSTLVGKMALVAVSGGLGAVARYGLDAAVRRMAPALAGRFPIGILLVEHARLPRVWTDLRPEW